MELADAHLRHRRSGHERHAKDDMVQRLGFKGLKPT